MSGVTIDSSCVEAYQKVKTCKNKCCLFKLSDDGKFIVPDEDSLLKFSRKPNPETFEKFLQLFPENKCRYGVYNVSIGCSCDGMTQVRDKLVFLTWAPDSAKIKDKMMIASSKESLKKACVGVAHDMQFSDESDICAGNWIDSIGSMTTMKIAGDITEFEGRCKDEW